jgi:putative heme-binding domain-containing protein
VQARTGPDGALYVVDMYRFLIEHPRWIAADRLAQIDARAGAEMGRIYRIVPKGKPLRAIRDLTKLTPADLASALETPNGTERDRVHLELLTRGGTEAVSAIEKVMLATGHGEVRVQCLAVLDGLHALTPAHLARSLVDLHPRVREHAVRLCEKFSGDESLVRALAALSADPDRGVRYQLALTLGEFADSHAGQALAALAALPDAKLPYFRAALLSSAPRHPAAVSALEAPALPPAVLAVASDADLQRLRAAPSATASARAEVLKKYRSVSSLTGTMSRGAEVFARACALCHSFGGVGFDVGPNLALLRDKPVDDWLKNILDPSGALEPRFASYIVEAKDGRTFAALIKAETATSLTLSQPGGIVATLLRKDVRAVQTSKTSLMPEGLEETISPQEIADLLAWLRAAPKNIAGNKPEAITPAADGTLKLPASKAEVFGGAITFEREFGNVGFWNNAGDFVAWTVRDAKAGAYDVWLDAACQPESAGNAFVFAGSGSELRGKVASTGGWDTYQRIKIGRVTLAGGEIRITMQPDGAVQGALLDLRAVELQPAQ